MGRVVIELQKIQGKACPNLGPTNFHFLVGFWTESKVLKRKSEVTFEGRFLQDGRTCVQESLSFFCACRHIIWYLCIYIYIHMSLFSHKCLDPTYCPSLKSFFVISNFLGQDDEPLYIYSCVYIYKYIYIYVYTFLRIQDDSGIPKKWQSTSVSYMTFCEKR